MYDHLFITMKDFLALHWKQGRPLLVACSGGPDSKALLYLLLECQKFFELEIHVAHVDHGWRLESAEESKILQKEVKGLGLKFHLQTLKDLPLKEGVARDARYAFFEQVVAQIGAQAIVLGHQMDDQGETVLKRVLEGASLPACGGMKAVSQLGSMVLWRPLLSCLKKDLKEWLENRGLAYFQDPTNLSSRYLRGRLRTSILPLLEESFGKSIVKNLCCLGERAQQIEFYLTKQVEPLWEHVEDSTISINLLKDLDGIIIDFFLKEWVRREKIHLSAQQLKLLRHMVLAPHSDRQLQTPTHRLEVQQGKLALKRVYSYLNR